MFAKTAKKQSDWFGAMASTLCLIHCLITPFIFVAKTCSVTACCHSSPLWWSALDLLFAAISLAAIRWTAQMTTLRWMPVVLYITWGLLMLVMVNDRVWGYPLGALAHLPALLLVGLHVYNHRYCRCGKEEGLCKQ